MPVPWLLRSSRCRRTEARAAMTTPAVLRILAVLLATGFDETIDVADCSHSHNEPSVPHAVHDDRPPDENETSSL